MGLRATPLESVRGGEERFIERGLAHAAQLLGLTVMDAVWLSPCATDKATDN